MLKRDVLKGPSCLTRAADDEPIFILRSTDELAPGIVQEWANDYRVAKGGWDNMTNAQRAKYFEAVAVAEAMDAWRLARTPTPTLGPNGECPICGGIESCKAGCQDGTSPL